MRKTDPKTGETYEWDGTRWTKVEKGPTARERGKSIGDYVIGGLNKLGSGITFGLNDEAAGVIGALGAMVPGGQSPREAYVRQRDAVRQSKGEFSEQFPLTGMALEAGGGLATGGIGAARSQALPLVQKIPSVMRTILGGTAGGAATGFGESEATTPGQLAKDTAVGAAFGGTVGPILAKGGQLAGVGLSKLGQGIAKLFQSPDAQAQKLLRDVLNETGMDMATFMQRMEQLGPDAVLADVSEATAFKLRSLADTDLGLGQRARDVVDARQAGAGGRLIDAAQQTMRVPADRFTTSLEALDDTRRAAARQQYGPIYDRPLPIDDTFEELMQRPSIAAGYQKALRTARDTGEPMTMQVMPDGSLQGAPTLAEIDRIKRGIDDVIRDNTDPITGKMNSDARNASRAKKALLEYVDQADPEVANAYRQARSTYAGFSAREEAMRMGRNILREDAERLEDAVSRMGDDEREAFKIGAFNAVRDEIEGKIDTADVSRARAFFTEANRRRLRHAFESDQEFDQFMKAVDRERTFASTRGTLQGNSITGRALAQQERQRKEGSGSVINPQASGFGTIMTLGQRALQAGPRNTEVADQLGNMLLGRGLPRRAAPTGPPPRGPGIFSGAGAGYGAGMGLYDPEFMGGLLGLQ